MTTPPVSSDRSAAVGAFEQYPVGPSHWVESLRRSSRVTAISTTSGVGRSTLESIFWRW
ncbi:MAG: hypothetical protein JW751_12115 [Polyangiaceae bacterium]|nr:hypothetical protein [Polyangiaceae bacterium]